MKNLKTFIEDGNFDLGLQKDLTIHPDDHEEIVGMVTQYEETTTSERIPVHYLEGHLNLRPFEAINSTGDYELPNSWSSLFKSQMHLGW
jgi:hypothetical protein